jgi:pyridoxal 5'-phosphate synthase pdxT subunit
MVDIGILALQGDYARHADQLHRCGVSWRLVKQPQQLAGIKGLIIPGGESSSLLKLMTPFHWQDALKDFVTQGGVILATCAGMILLAKEVVPSQESLGLIDITVQRNAYGRQLESFIAQGEITDPVLGDGALEMVFIRAPKVMQVHQGVRVLASYNKEPMLVQQGNVIVASFHPELSQDATVHQYFCRQLEFVVPPSL